MLRKNKPPPEQNNVIHSPFQHKNVIEDHQEDFTNAESGYSYEMKQMSKDSEFSFKSDEGATNPLLNAYLDDGNSNNSKLGGGSNAVLVNEVPRGGILIAPNREVHSYHESYHNNHSTASEYVVTTFESEEKYDAEDNGNDDNNINSRDGIEGHTNFNKGYYSASTSHSHYSNETYKASNTIDTILNDNSNNNKNRSTNKNPHRAYNSNRNNRNRSSSPGKRAESLKHVCEDPLNPSLGIFQMFTRPYIVSGIRGGSGIYSRRGSYRTKMHAHK